MWLRLSIFLFAISVSPGLISLTEESPSVSSQQASEDSPAQRFDKAFKAAHDLVEQHKPAEALSRYEEALAIKPDDTSVLFNAGLAAYLSNNFNRAAELWKRLKALDADDWRARSKLIQAYQALGQMQERNTERAELIELWRSGKNEDLSKQPEYCREQFEVNGTRVMVFEHFEFKGDRPVRYLFSVLTSEGKEDHWYSLGSYETTNQVWHETTKPAPPKEQRLFHLDGYFKNGHATYGMMIGEPSYEETRAIVVKVIKGEIKPISSSTWAPGSNTPKPE